MDIMINPPELKNRYHQSNGSLSMKGEKIIGGKKHKAQILTVGEKLN
jgi:hypothetical protein